MKKYVLITIVILAALIFSGCSKKEKILGEDWLLLQDSSMEELTLFTESMDNVYALYFANMISEEDFRQELLGLNHTYNILQAQYQELKEKYEIVPESHTYVSKKGSEAIENIRTALSNVLMDSVMEDGTPKPVDELSYLYLAYRDECATYLAEYMVSLRWVMDFEEYMENGFVDESGIDASQDVETENAEDSPSDKVIP